MYLLEDTLIFFLYQQKWLGVITKLIWAHHVHAAKRKKLAKLHLAWVGHSVSWLTSRGALLIKVSILKITNIHT